MATAAAIAGCGDSDASRAAHAHPLDDVLRVQHVQMEGSHNSYHLRPENPLFAAIAPVVGWAYDMPTLTEQLDRDGVRQLEIDVHWVASEGTFRVHHLPVLDPRSTCPYLRDCLAELRAWSETHRGHHPILITIEPKDEVDVLSPITGRLDELDAELLAGLGAERVVTPDEAQGAHATLRDALATEGWPTLGATRGRFVLVLLDSGEFRDEYTADGTSLSGRAMFVTGDPGDPLAAMTSTDDPAEIVARARAGLLVRELSATEGTPPAEAAAEVAEDFDAGYHAVSTDFPSAVLTPAFHVATPGGTPSRCNPVTAPPECTAQAVEDPRRL